MECWVEGVRCRVWGLWFRVSGLGFGVWGLGLRVWGQGFTRVKIIAAVTHFEADLVEGLGFRV